MEKPSLHEIAAMPFPESVFAMRKFYVHDWGKPIAEGLSQKQTYQVTARVTLRTVEREFFEIEAWSQDEAEEEAEGMIDRRYPEADDVEIDELKVSLVEAAQ